MSISSDNTGGIYCFFPFERFDETDKGVFKIGNTEQSFQKRLNQYHTYFVGGVWAICLIKVYAKRGKEIPLNFKHILNTIETYVIREIVKEGGTIIVDKRRVWKQGESEWIYTHPNIVKKCFQKTVVHFKTIYKDLNFLLDSSDIKKTIKEVNKTYQQNMRKQEKYIAEYIFNVNKKDNQK